MKKIITPLLIAFTLLAVNFVSAQTYEAESGSTPGSTASYSNATGSGNNVVYTFSASGGQNKIINVNGGVGGSGTIKIRYSNGDATNKTLNFNTYASDGSTVNSTTAVTFPPTGGWNTFAVVAVPYTLTFLAGNVGGNNFKLRNDAASAVNVAIDNYTISVTGAYVAVSSIAVTPSSTSVNVASTTNLSVAFTPSNATNQTVAWSSSDPSKATVSSAGVVTGVSAGSATITATSQNDAKTSSSSITVNFVNVPVTGVSVSPSSVSVGIGATTSLTATISPSNAINKTVTWTSSNDAVATVSASGVVTGVAVGTATITATTQDGSFTSSSSISVITIPVTGVTVSPSTTTVVAGAYIPLTATIAPVTATNKTVNWSSSNNAVARVSASGVVTGMAVGSATITATTQDGSFTSTSSVTVSAAAANYALNPDFELNAPAASPTSWFEWTGSANNYIINSNVVAGNSGLGNAVGGTPHSGSYYIAIAPTVTWATTYDVLNKQDLTGLPNGTYTLKAWFRGNGGSGYFNNGGTYNNFAFPMSQWTQKTISNISVTNGTTTINIQYNSTAGTELDIDDLQLTLNQMVLVTGINSVTPATKTLSLNETTTLTTTTIPSNASNSTINWSSSNTAVATVSAAGVVTAVSAGIATITATSSEGGFTSTAVITVQPNYVLNPGFEANGTAVALASSWAEWSATSAYTDNSNVITGNVGLGDAVGGAPHGGSYYIEVAPTGANTNTYGVLNFQSIANIPNGTYTLTGWFRGNGGSGNLNVGGIYNSFNFTNMSQWTQYTINNVVITNGTCQVQVDYSTTQGYKLDIDDIQLRPAGITISGVQNSSALTNPNADISVTSTGDLTIDASRSVYNITVDGGGKVTLNNAAALTVNNLTLNSDGTNGTGTFVDKNSSAGSLTVNGTTTVQQYLSSGRNWYISSPVSGATSNVFSASVGNPLYWYDEAHGSTVPWATITNTSTTLNVMQGYVANLASSGVVSFTGALNTGSKTITVYRTDTQTKAGFNLVGNPYSSYLDWDQVSLTNLSTSIWQRTKNTGNTSYVFDTYNSSGKMYTNNSGKTVNSHIPPMQAFWVRVNNGFSSGSMTVNNAMRSNKGTQLTGLGSVTDPMFKSSTVKSDLPSVLRMQVSNGTATDETIIYSNPNALNNYDNYDSPKMFSNSVSVAEIYTLAESEQLAINGLNAIQYDTEIPLGFSTLSSGNFSLTASQISNFEAGTKIILKDYLDANNPIITDLSNESSYSFTSPVTSNNISRFSLIFKAPSAITEISSTGNTGVWLSTDTKGQIKINGNPADGTSITVYNAVGQKIISKNITKSYKQLEILFESGIYMVQLSNAGNTITKKIIVN